MRDSFRILLIAAKVVVASSAAFANAPRITGIASVTDGDTIAVGPIRVRLHGIDAPEAGQTCKRADGKSWQCGTEATNHLADLVERQPVECRAFDRDLYGRIIATCEAAGVDINGSLIDAGLAWA